MDKSQEMEQILNFHLRMTFETGKWIANTVGLEDGDYIQSIHRYYGKSKRSKKSWKDYMMV